MEIYKTEEFIQMENPTPGERYKGKILTNEHKAKELNGIFGVLGPGNQVPYHYHKERESLIIVISGEATEIVEGKEFPIKAGDVIFLLSGEKHMMVNRSNKDIRYLEFYSPVKPDRVEVIQTDTGK
jgi:quercetin dioxygenase-like cupin family protein